MQVTHVDITKDRQETVRTEIELGRVGTPPDSTVQSPNHKTLRNGPARTRGRRKSGLFANARLRFRKRKRTKTELRFHLRWDRVHCDIITGILRHGNVFVTVEADRSKALSRRGKNRMMQKKSKKKGLLSLRSHSQKKVLFAEPHLCRTDCAH